MKWKQIIATVPIIICSLLSGCTQLGAIAIDKNAIPVIAESLPTVQNSPSPSPTPIPTPSPTPTPIPTPTLVAYNGPIRHIFFHPLIVFSERAFDGDFMEKGYNDWFVTEKEFKLMIDSIYKNNYILIDINSMYELKTENGKTTITRKQLMLPEGKKPLVISIDDLNYYKYMLDNGNASKLVLDSEGNVRTLSVQIDGTQTIGSDDIVPILDDFVKLHPDFSFNGAKGTIALTGYEGVLGYRTNNIDSPDYNNEKAEALKVIARLKETGWNFACHGYGHRNAGKISKEKLIDDTNRWKTEVESLIGYTPVYIYPFGARVNEQENDPKLESLMSLGFHIFCAVGPDGVVSYHSSFVTLDRKSIDGLSLHIKSKYLTDLFDIESVIDSARPDNY
jgi:Predicted xylanase/chitin deacetylase